MKNAATSGRPAGRHARSAEEVRSSSSEASSSARSAGRSARPAAREGEADAFPRERITRPCCVTYGWVLVLLAGSFLSSFCMGGEPQAKPARPPQAKSRSGAGASKAASKIKVADATPEDALRTFMLAVMAQDEAALRAVTLPNPDLDWLLKGQPARRK